MKCLFEAGYVVVAACPRPADLHASSPLQHLHDAVARGEPGVAWVGGDLRVSVDRLRASRDPLLAALGVHRYLGVCSIHERGLVGHPNYHWELDWTGALKASGPWLSDGTRYWLLDAEHETVARLAGEVAGLGKLEVFRRVHQLARLAKDHPRVLPTRRLLSRTIVYPDEVRPDPANRAPRLLERGTELVVDVRSLQAIVLACALKGGVVKLPGEDRWLILDQRMARAALALFPGTDVVFQESSPATPALQLLAPSPPPRAVPEAAWLVALPSDGARKVFSHLAQHTTLTEAEVLPMFPNKRSYRAFSLEFEGCVALAPFDVQIHVGDGTEKRYVRVERSR